MDGSRRFECRGSSAPTNFDNKFCSFAHPKPVEDHRNRIPTWLFTPWLNYRTSAQLLDGARLVQGCFPSCQMPVSIVECCQMPMSIFRTENLRCQISNCRVLRRVAQKNSVARCQVQLSTAEASCPEKILSVRCRLLSAV